MISSPSNAKLRRPGGGAAGDNTSSSSTSISSNNTNQDLEHGGGNTEYHDDDDNAFLVSVSSLVDKQEAMLLPTTTSLLRSKSTSVIIVCTKKSSLLWHNICCHRHYRLVLKILGLLVALIMAVVLMFAGYWFAVYWGYLSRPIIILTTGSSSSSSNNNGDHGDAKWNKSCPVQEWPRPNCAHHLTHKQGDAIAPVYTPEQWHEYRQKYQESVQQTSSLARGWEHLYKEESAPEEATTAAAAATATATPNTGFVSPVDIQISPGKGRGVYAAARIARGEKIWDNRYRVFDSECAARLFLSKLNSEEEVCNALFWGYTNNFHGNGFQWMIDLDGHGYFNHCSETGDKRHWNSVHHFEGEMDRNRYGLPRFLSFSLPQWGIGEETLARRAVPGAHGLYATRDISPGEEICFDYEDIHQNGLFDYFTFFFAHALEWHQWLTM